jgi:putative ABC transport system substrate-binding protein
MPVGRTNRRAFIAALGSAAAAWPVVARAQRAIPVVGWLGIAPASSNASRLAGVRLGLRDVGYVEGTNVVFEFRWAESLDQLPKLAAELVKREVAVIVATGNAATRAARTATSRIPIVFAAADDPVRLGYVVSFNRPGGNLTGLSLISGALGAKRLELARELVPNATVIAVLTNPNNPAAEGRDEQRIAHTIGQRVLLLNASAVSEIEQAFQTLARERAEVLVVNADAFFTAQRELLVTLAARHNLPAIYAWREFVQAGGLMSYGTSLFASYQQMGTYVGRILKGEKPADLPIMQPTQFELVINLKAAKAYGLDISPKLLARL